MYFDKTWSASCTREVPQLRAQKACALCQKSELQRRNILPLLEKKKFASVPGQASEHSEFQKQAVELSEHHYAYSLKGQHNESRGRHSTQTVRSTCFMRFFAVCVLAGATVPVETLMLTIATTLSNTDVT